MKFKVDTQSLIEIYLVSNTASFLYNGFCKSNSVLELRKFVPQHILIEEFITISKQEIGEIDSLAYAYAIYIAILSFNNDISVEFVRGVGAINFEWFPDLKSLFLSRFKSFNYNKFDNENNENESPRYSVTKNSQFENIALQ